jgi:hypothetical protein
MTAAQRLILGQVRRTLCASGVILSLALGTGAEAQAHLCDAAASLAARETGVPLDVLRTLTRVETGRSRAGLLEPWPWTLNMGGDGSWHDSATLALTAAQRAIAEGRRNVDLGCFQINYHWHGAAFSGLAAMLDPVSNARYAAAFLLDLHAELGNWTAAAGAFHSRNPEHATRYLARYRGISAALSDPDRDQGVDPAPPWIARVGPGRPLPLSMLPRPALGAAGQAGLITAARPVRTTPARPLWEMP